MERIYIFRYTEVGDTTLKRMEFKASNVADALFQASNYFLKINVETFEIKF